MEGSSDVANVLLKAPAPATTASGDLLGWKMIAALNASTGDIDDKERLEVFQQVSPHSARVHTYQPQQQA